MPVDLISLRLESVVCYHFSSIEADITAAMTLSGRILVGLAAGIATGLFFGELVADLKIVGDVFVKLLQITVLPYIIASLISGIGRMDLVQARQLAVRGLAVLLVIWIIALVLIFTVAYAFPDIDTASFFGSAASVSTEQLDLLELYLPSNIFYSLSNNLVPAVVLFSILLGISLITIEEKDGILTVFDGIAQAMARINILMVSLTPYGIFAISAAAAGTMTIEELGMVQVYLVTYVALALLIAFWIFPGLVAAVSGIPFRDVLDAFRDPLVTAFATGNQFVVLPQLAQNCKELLKRHSVEGEEAEGAIDVLVPVSFNFPSLGKLLVLLFVLFAAWFTDTELGLPEQVSLAFGGLLSLFGSLNVAVPYMLNSLHIPADMFQLFLVTGIVVGRFGAMLAALHIAVVSVVGTLALVGKINITLKSSLRYLLLSGVAVAILIATLRVYFELFVPPPPPREEVLARVEQSQQWMQARVYDTVPAADVLVAGESRLDHVFSTGLLRVGYRPKNLPCSYLTPEDRLVGFDVEMAQYLAEDMGVTVEFVPFEFDALGSLLNSGQIDIAMSCIASLPDRFAYTSFSRPYLDMSLGFVVRDHERELFRDLQSLQRVESLTIALVSTHYNEGRLRRLLPNADIILLQSAEEFFVGGDHSADAMMLTVEEGMAYSYRYPLYTVVRSPRNTALPAAYPVPKGDVEMMEFVSNWIELKKMDGTVDQLYQYWMQGGATQSREPRWSVIRDVLGWID